MGRLMIKAEDISVRFQLANDRINTLKEFAIACATKRLRFQEFWALQQISFEVKKARCLELSGKTVQAKARCLR